MSTQLISQTQPDANGYFTRVEHYVNEKGQKIKATIRLQTRMVPVKIKRAVYERRQWAGFGDYEDLATLHTCQSIDLDVRIKKPNVSESKESDVLAAPSIIKCRQCGEPGHFTAKCPLNNLPSYSKKKAADTAEQEQKTTTDIEMPLEQEPNIKISNLSEDASEDDLRELCRRFGYITRVSIVRDKETGRSHGLAFVHFTCMADAQAAVKSLHKHPYDSQVLEVELAKPKAWRSNGTILAVPPQRPRFYNSNKISK